VTNTLKFTGNRAVGLIDWLNLLALILESACAEKAGGASLTRTSSVTTPPAILGIGSRADGLRVRGEGESVQDQPGPPCCRKLDNDNP